MIDQTIFPTDFYILVTWPLQCADVKRQAEPDIDHSRGLEHPNCLYNRLFCASQCFSPQGVQMGISEFNAGGGG